METDGNYTSTHDAQGNDTHGRDGERCDAECGDRKRHRCHRDHAGGDDPHGDHAEGRMTDGDDAASPRRSVLRRRATEAGAASQQPRRVAMRVASRRAAK